MVVSCQLNKNAKYVAEHRLGSASFLFFFLFAQSGLWSTWSLLLGRERQDKTSYSDEGELHLMSEGENRRGLCHVLVVFLKHAAETLLENRRRQQQRQLDSLVFFPLLFFPSLSVILRRFSLLLHYAFIDKSMFFHSIRADEDFLVKTINNEQYSFTLVLRVARISS